MAIRAIQLAAPEWFTPASQKKEADPAKFLINGMNGYQQAALSAEVTISAKGDLNFTARGITLLFEFGLTDWSGVTDQNGQPIDYKKLTPLEAQNLLHYNDQVAVAVRIFKQSFISADDKKK